MMPLWQRLLATLVAMILTSLIAGLIWEALFGFPLPSYLAGMIGGVTAVPVWEFLKRIGPRGGGGQPAPGEERF
jgi:hypothetical protein